MSDPAPKPRLRARAHSSPQPRKPGPIAAAQAKAHLLQLIDEVSRDRVPVIISKRGKPLVQLVPLDDAAPGDPFGCMQGTVKIAGDIVGPEPDRWEAME